MTEEEIEVMVELERIFMPLAHKKRDKIRREGGGFVHYTSAEKCREHHTFQDYLDEER